MIKLFAAVTPDGKPFTGSYTKGNPFYSRRGFAEAQAIQSRAKVQEFVAVPIEEYQKLYRDSVLLRDLLDTDAINLDSKIWQMHSAGE